MTRRSFSTLRRALEKFFDLICCPPFCFVTCTGRSLAPCIQYKIRFICIDYGEIKSCMPHVGKFDQTLLDYFAMFLLCLMLKMVELKELCFLV